MLFASLAALGGAHSEEPVASDLELATDALAPLGGLSVIWRIDGRMHDLVVPDRSTQTFAPDGRELGVLDSVAIRAISSADPRVVRSIPHGFGPRAYSLSVSSEGRIAAGHVGGIHLYKPGVSRSSWIACVDPCGPVLALAFSPNGALLAYQGTRGLGDRQRGLGSVVVLDAGDGSLVAELPAVAAKAFVEFSADGTRLTASHATLFDDIEYHGLHTWDTSDWSLIRRLRGSTQRWRAIGTQNDRRIGAYFGEGALEVRDIESGAPIWSVPLIGPSIGSSTRVERAATRLDLVQFAPNGEFVVSYESAATAPNQRATGTIVIRATRNGQAEAMYDVADVTSLAIAPDSRTFVYGTGAGQTHRVMARIPFAEDPERAGSASDSAN